MVDFPDIEQIFYYVCIDFEGRPAILEVKLLSKSEIDNKNESIQAVIKCIDTKDVMQVQLIMNEYNKSWSYSWIDLFGSLVSEP